MKNTDDMLPFLTNVSGHIYKYMHTHAHTDMMHRNMVWIIWGVKGQLLSCLIFLSWWKEASLQHSWINGEHMLGGGRYLPVAAI